MSAPLHITNGEAARAAVALAAGVEPAAVLAWQDILHDGPVPAGLEPEALAEVRAAHLAARGWADEEAARFELAFRDAAVAAHPADAPVVLWFEDDLFDRLQLAQVAHRLAGRPGPVELVTIPHDRSAGLTVAPRRRYVPDGADFDALRSPDPRAWERVAGFERLCEELPDVRTGLGRVERQVLEVLADGPQDPGTLFVAVAAYEDPPWLGDRAVWAIADDLGDLVSRTPAGYAPTAAGRAVLAGDAERPPTRRWIGGVRIGPDRPDFRWDPRAGRVVLAG